MKALIIRGTTLNGEAVNENDVIELDSTSFQTFKAYGQASEATAEDIKKFEEAKAKAPAKGK